MLIIFWRRWVANQWFNGLEKTGLELRVVNITQLTNFLVRCLPTEIWLKIITFCLLIDI